MAPPTTRPPQPSSKKAPPRRLASAASSAREALQLGGQVVGGSTTVASIFAQFAQSPSVQTPEARRLAARAAAAAASVEASTPKKNSSSSGLSPGTAVSLRGVRAGGGEASASPPGSVAEGHHSPAPSGGGVSASSVSLPAEVHVAFTLAAKSCAKTRARGLAEVEAWLGRLDADEVETLLPQFTYLYQRLALADSQARLRAAAHCCLRVVLEKLGRRIAPSLRELLPPLFLGLYDSEREAARAAARAFDAAFPLSSPARPDVLQGLAKRRAAIEHCRLFILTALKRFLLLKNASLTQQLGTLTGLFESPEEERRCLDRHLSCSLLAASDLVSLLSCSLPPEKRRERGAAGEKRAGDEGGGEGTFSSVFEGSSSLKDWRCDLDFLFEGESRVLLFLGPSYSLSVRSAAAVACASILEAFAKCALPLPPAPLPSSPCDSEGGDLASAERVAEWLTAAARALSDDGFCGASSPDCFGLANKQPLFCASEENAGRASPSSERLPSTAGSLVLRAVRLLLHRFLSAAAVRDLDSACTRTKEALENSRTNKAPFSAEQAPARKKQAPLERVAIQLWLTLPSLLRLASNGGEILKDCRMSPAVQTPLGAATPREFGCECSGFSGRRGFYEELPPFLVALPPSLLTSQSPVAEESFLETLLRCLMAPVERRFFLSVSAERGGASKESTERRPLARQTDAEEGAPLSVTRRKDKQPTAAPVFDAARAPPVSSVVGSFYSAILLLAKRRLPQPPPSEQGTPSTGCTDTPNDSGALLLSIFCEAVSKPLDLFAKAKEQLAALEFYSAECGAAEGVGAAAGEGVSSQLSVLNEEAEAIPAVVSWFAKECLVRELCAKLRLSLWRGVQDAILPLQFLRPSTSGAERSCRAARDLLSEKSLRLGAADCRAFAFQAANVGAPLLKWLIKDPATDGGGLQGAAARTAAAAAAMLLGGCLSRRVVGEACLQFSSWINFSGLAAAQRRGLSSDPEALDLLLKAVHALLSQNVLPATKRQLKDAQGQVGLEVRIPAGDAVATAEELLQLSLQTLAVALEDVCGGISSGRRLSFEALPALWRFVDFVVSPLLSLAVGNPKGNPSGEAAADDAPNIPLEDALELLCIGNVYTANASLLHGVCTFNVIQRLARDLCTGRQEGVWPNAISAWTHSNFASRLLLTLGLLDTFVRRCDRHPIAVVFLLKGATGDAAASSLLDGFFQFLKAALWLPTLPEDSQAPFRGRFFISLDDKETAKAIEITASLEARTREFHATFHDVAASFLVSREAILASAGSSFSLHRYSIATSLLAGLCYGCFRLPAESREAFAALLGSLSPCRRETLLVILCQSVGGCFMGDYTEADSLLAYWCEAQKEAMARCQKDAGVQAYAIAEYWRAVVKREISPPADAKQTAAAASALVSAVFFKALAFKPLNAELLAVWQEGVGFRWKAFRRFFSELVEIEGHEEADFFEALIREGLAEESSARPASAREAMLDCLLHGLIYTDAEATQKQARSCCCSHSRASCEVLLSRGFGCLFERRDLAEEELKKLVRTLVALRSLQGEGEAVALSPRADQALVRRLLQKLLKCLVGSEKPLGTKLEAAAQLVKILFQNYSLEARSPSAASGAERLLSADFSVEEFWGISCWLSSLLEYLAQAADEASQCSCEEKAQRQNLLLAFLQPLRKRFGEAVRALVIAASEDSSRLRLSAFLLKTAASLQLLASLKEACFACDGGAEEPSVGESAEAALEEVTRPLVKAVEDADGASDAPPAECREARLLFWEGLCRFSFVACTNSTRPRRSSGSEGDSGVSKTAQTLCARLATLALRAVSDDLQERRVSEQNEDAALPGLWVFRLTKTLLKDAALGTPLPENVSVVSWLLSAFVEAALRVDEALEAASQETAETSSAPCCASACGEGLSWLAGALVEALQALRLSGAAVAGTRLLAPLLAARSPFLQSAVFEAFSSFPWMIEPLGGCSLKPDASEASLCSEKEKVVRDGVLDHLRRQRVAKNEAEFEEAASEEGSKAKERLLLLARVLGGGEEEAVAEDDAEEEERRRKEDAQRRQLQETLPEDAASSEALEQTAASDASAEGIENLRRRGKNGDLDGEAQNLRGLFEALLGPVMAALLFETYSLTQRLLTLHLQLHSAEQRPRKTQLRRGDVGLLLQREEQQALRDVRLCLRSWVLCLQPIASEDLAAQLQGQIHDESQSQSSPAEEQSASAERRCGELSSHKAALVSALSARPRTAAASLAVEKELEFSDEASEDADSEEEAEGEASAEEALRRQLSQLSLVEVLLQMVVQVLVVYGHPVKPSRAALQDPAAKLGGEGNPDWRDRIRRDAAAAAVSRSQGAAPAQSLTLLETLSLAETGWHEDESFAWLLAARVYALLLLACPRIPPVRRRSWVLSSARKMDASNVGAGLALWCQNLGSFFGGAEDCPICLSAVQPQFKTLPRSKCSTCRKKFHSECIYRWFRISKNTVCPHCRALI